MEMRRKDRLVDDPDELRLILEECKVCRIATMDEEGLYIVPLNFGYAEENGKRVFYFHSAKSGRKLDLIARSDEMDTGHQLMEGDTACQTSYRYMSIIGNGSIHELDDNTEKAGALNALMKHLSGRTFEFNDKMLNAVAVFKIDVSRFSGKRRI